MAADPGYVIALYHIGVLHERLGNVDGAIEAFSSVADANPNDAAAHYHLGLNYKHKGLDDLAIGEFTHALQIDPSDRASEAELQSLERCRRRRSPAALYGVATWRVAGS